MNKPFALIIEDDRDIAALFRHVLDLAGFQTEVIFDGHTALERLSHDQPDLVLLDLNLPGASGHQVIGMIRKDDRLNYTKVVVVTGYPHVASGLTRLSKNQFLGEPSPSRVPPRDQILALQAVSVFFALPGLRSVPRRCGSCRYCVPEQTTPIVHPLSVWYAG